MTPPDGGPFTGDGDGDGGGAGVGGLRACVTVTREA